MAKSDWMLIRRIRNGHSYWRRKNDGAIGIADQSGTYPEDCEPGDNPPLLLDKSRPVTINEKWNHIPIKHENGRTSHTVASGFEVLWVASHFHMAVEATEAWDTNPWRFIMVDVASFEASGNDMAAIRKQWAIDLLNEK